MDIQKSFGISKHFRIFLLDSLILSLENGVWYLENNASGTENTWDITANYGSIGCNELKNKNYPLILYYEIL